MAAKQGLVGAVVECVVNRLVVPAKRRVTESLTAAPEYPVQATVVSL